MNGRLHGLLALAPLAFAYACGGDPQPPVAAATPGATARTPEAPATPIASAAPTAAPPKVSLVELQRKTLQAQVAAMRAADAKKLGETYTEDAVIQQMLGPTGWVESKGRQAVVDDFDSFLKKAQVMPAMVRAVQKDDVVIYEWTMSGTDKGAKKNFAYRGATVAWFDENGLVKKERGYFDPITPGIQIGKLPGIARATTPFAGEPTWVVPTHDPAEAKNLEAVKNGWTTAWTKKDRAAYEALLADDFVEEPIAAPTDLKGKTAAGTALTTMAKAVPDVALSIDSAWAAGDLIVLEYTLSGTQKGSLGPIPPTGRKLAIHGLQFMQLKDGKVAKATTYTSGAELLGQLGLLPPSGKPAKKSDSATPAKK
jgi:steroid delta-isomerase-like uncharacterized protein